jgi:hypothetical protein
MSMLFSEAVTTGQPLLEALLSSTDCSRVFSAPKT